MLCVQRFETIEELREIEGVADDDEVRVVTDIGRGRTEMKDRLGRRSAVGKGLEVGHHIVPGALLALPHPLEVVGLGHPGGGRVRPECAIRHRLAPLVGRLANLTQRLRMLIDVLCEALQL